MGSKQLPIYLLHIRDCCERLIECAALRQRKTTPEQVLLDAACRNLEILGEAANKTDPEFRATHPEIPWRQMVAARNVLIHAYEGTDPEIVWGIVDARDSRFAGSGSAIDRRQERLMDVKCRDAGVWWTGDLRAGILESKLVSVFE